MSDIRKAFKTAVIEEARNLFTIGGKIHPKDQELIDTFEIKINALNGAKDGTISMLDIMDIAVDDCGMMEHETLFRLLVEVITEEGK